MIDATEIKAFFQSFADALMVGDRQKYAEFFKLPIGLLYPSKVVTVDDLDILGIKLCRVTEEVQSRLVGSLVANPIASKIRDGAFPVKVRYTMRSLSGQDMGVFTSDYYCEVQPDGTFLISFASCELLKQLEEH